MIERLRGLFGLVHRAFPVGLGLVFLFVGQGLLARLMGPDGFGEYSYLLTWITVTALLAKAGHEWVILKAVPGRIAGERIGEIRFLVARAAKAVLSRAALGVVLLLALAWVINTTHDLSASIMSAGAMLVVAIALGEMRRAFALAYGAVWIAEAPETILKSSALVLVAAYLSITGTVAPSAMLWANLVSTVVLSASALWIFLVLKVPGICTVSAVPIETKDLDDLMRSMWVTNLLNIALRNADILIIGLLTDFASTGIYIAATRIAALAAAPVMILDRVVAPRLAAAAESRAKDRLSAESWEYAILSTLGCLTFVVLLGLWGEDFISLLFGASFTEAIAVTWILLIGHFANAITGPTGVLLSMTGSHRVLLMTACLSAAVYIVLLYAWTPTHLAVGAAAAFACTHSLKAVIQMVFVRRRLSINPTAFRYPRAQ